MLNGFLVWLVFPFVYALTRSVTGVCLAKMWRHHPLGWCRVRMWQLKVGDVIWHSDFDYPMRVIEAPTFLANVLVWHLMAEEYTPGA